MSLSRFPLVEKRPSEQPGAPMELRYGKIDLESEATKLYETRMRTSVRRCAQTVPDYNHAQTIDALDYIIEVLESAFAEAIRTSNDSPSQNIWARTCRTA
jgi:hypothetical protein